MTAPTEARATLGSRLRDKLLAENGRSPAAWARARRSGALLRRFPDLPTMRVIDLGGTAWHWESSALRPARVLIVNIDASSLGASAEWITTLEGDACALPAHVLEEPFDLVYSNSVIEHVGGHAQRRAFADAVRRLADHHWVQTPARSFPLEPHWIFPGFQFLPVAARVAVSRRWPLAPPGFRGRPPDKALDDVLGIELVSRAEMRGLFPGSELVRERIAGLTKSIIAVR